jgi:hypothetical protein
VTALVSFGITIAPEAGARPPDAVAYALGAAGAIGCWRVAAGRSRS